MTTTPIPEDVYRGELIAFPNAWSFQLGKAHIILVSDKELEDLSDPDKVLNLTLTFEPRHESLRQVCERAQARGARMLILAFDHFFSQYRPGQAGPRQLMPDMDEYVQRIARTALFRARYYHLLQDGVVALFLQARRYAEERVGSRIETRAHATWAESPTIDRWDSGRENHARHQYEYTSNFVWSNTVQQAASACYDYFKWGDYLTGTGNDHAECGWSDRNYVGLALACSTGILNEIPYSYAAHWGMPHELARRRSSLVNVYGAAGA